VSKLDKRLRARTPSARRKAIFKRNFHSVERVKFMRSQPCEVTKIESDTVQNAHMRTRGSGGTYLDIVPLSFEVHMDFDRMSEWDFYQKYKREKQSVRDRAYYYRQLWEDNRD